MRDRGTYGSLRVGADPYDQRSSIGSWVLGGVLIGGAVLWAKYQSDQIEKLYATAGLTHQSFADNLRQRSSALTATAGEKVQGIARRLGMKREATTSNFPPVVPLFPVIKKAD